MINIEEVLLSIIITAVIVTAILYYYSAKFDSHDIDIQILESNSKFDLINIEALQEQILEIQKKITDMEK